VAEIYCAAGSGAAECVGWGNWVEWWVLKLEVREEMDRVRNGDHGCYCWDGSPDHSLVVKSSHEIFGIEERSGLMKELGSRYLRY
jgi:hypothetical protein